jgi:hypothetical protein
MPYLCTRKFKVNSIADFFADLPPLRAIYIAKLFILTISERSKKLGADHLPHDVERGRCYGSKDGLAEVRIAGNGISRNRICIERQDYYED